jgi:hypothetical protein
MKFLDGPKVEAAIKELLSTAKHVRVAVAYWGDGAVKRLGIKRMKKDDVQVVCDVLSGGCNPKEVKSLRKVLGDDRVKTCDRLHAKVWLTDKGAIIGSSNASANGLGYEGDEAAGLIEANILVDDRPTLEEIARWFDNIPGARSITDADLTRARPLWKKHRAGRPVPEGKSILEELITNPAAFADRNFRVWVECLPDYDDWAKKMFQAATKELHNSSISCWQFDVEERIPLPGEYILHFQVGKGDKAKYEEFSQVLQDDPVKPRRGRGRGCIVLTRPVKDYCNLPLGNKKAWADAATRAVKSTDTGAWEGDIQSFGRQFLSADVKRRV